MSFFHGSLRDQSLFFLCLKKAANHGNCSLFAAVMVAHTCTRAETATKFRSLSFLDIYNLTAEVASKPDIINDFIDHYYRFSQRRIFCSNISSKMAFVVNQVALLVSLSAILLATMPKHLFIFFNTGEMYTR